MKAPALFVLLLAALLTACDRSPLTDPPAAPQLVLALGLPDYPVMKQAAAEIARRNESLRRNSPPLGIEFHNVEIDRDTDAEVRKLLPRIDQFRFIFTPSQTVARAAQLLVPDRPIVFDGVEDPVANCLVDSLAHPGRNATGYMHMLPDTEAKTLEVLHDGFPSLRRVIVLVSGLNTPSLPCNESSMPPEDPPCFTGLHGVDSDVQQLIDADRVEATARRLGVTVHFLVMCRPEDFALARNVVAGGPTDAVGETGLLVPWHSLFDDHIEPLMAVLTAMRRPAIYPNSRFIDAGGLMSIEPILDRGKDRASVLALMQVIEGRDPATLPVQGPRGFEVVFNAAAAAEQGLRPSRMLLHRADRIRP